MTHIEAARVSHTRRSGSERWGIGIVVLSLFLGGGCGNSGDPQKVEEESSELKRHVADATNALLYLIKGLDVQGRQVEIITKEMEEVKASSGQADGARMLDLKPRIERLLNDLTATRRVQLETGEAVVSSARRLAEIASDLAEYERLLPSKRDTLGSTWSYLNAALMKAKSAVGAIRTLIEGMNSYNETVVRMNSGASGMLNEIETFAKNKSLTDDVAALGRLTGFSNGISGGFLELAKVVKLELASRNAALDHLIDCFRELNKISYRDPRLATELQEAVKLLEDVRKGMPFEAK